MGSTITHSTVPEGFRRLSPNVFLYSPPSTPPATRHGDTDGISPPLIVLLTWMSAPLRPISKYISGYQDLYPQTPILLITNTVPDMLWRRDGLQRARLAAAVDVTLSHVPAESSKRLLLHLMSNGGAQQACQYAAAYREHTGRCLPVGAMVLDSAPGWGTYRRAADAMLLTVPREALVLVRMFATIIVHAVLVVAFVYHGVTATQNVVEKLREGLLDQTLFASDAPRSYLYSKADRLVWWEDVEDHADLAAKKGWAVEKVCFQESNHAAHVLEDRERYWSTIRKSWKNHAR